MSESTPQRVDHHDALLQHRIAVVTGGVAARYCARLFARLGADVVRVPAPGSTDAEPRAGYMEDAERHYDEWLDDGSVEVAGLEQLGGTVDLIVAGQDAATVAAVDTWLTGRGTAATSRPTMLALTWFDLTGPYASWTGSDEIIHALGGLAYGYGRPDGSPTLPQGHTPQLLAGVNAFTAGVAALLALPGDRPRRIDVNVLESVVCLTEVAALRGLDGHRDRSVRLGVNRHPPSYPCTSYRTADGWVGVTCLTPGQWASLAELIGRPELGHEERFLTSNGRLRNADEIDALLQPALRGRTTAEWVADADAVRLPLCPMAAPGDLPAMEHWVQRGTFIPFRGDVEAPTLPFRMSFTGSPVARWSAATPHGPLSGLRVADFSMGWAGPLATRLLGDLGAEVIKVESATHPDWWRGWEPDDGSDPPPIELKVNFNGMNRNKQGLSVDLASPDGLARARALIAQSDVVISNFAAGVMERLGLGPADVRALQPDVVYLSMPAFGPTGPLSGLRAYGSTVEQSSGLPFVNGEPEWAPSIQHVALGDPISGMYAGVALMTALAARGRLGGCDIDFAQVECLFQLSADAILAEQAIGTAVPRRGNRRLRAAPCCVVPADGDDRWLAVAVDSMGAWRGLCHVLDRADWADDDELASLEGRQARADEIEAEIARWARARRATDAATTLQRGGVAAAPVQPGHEVGDDAQLSATGFWGWMDRRYVGRHAHARSPFRFDGERAPLRRPAPVLGEHTDEVVGMLALG